MDLDYGPEYDVFRKQVRAFIEAHSHLAPPSADRAARPSSKAVEWQKLLIEHGYAARTIPQEYGGYGAEPDILQSRIIAEEFARARVAGGLANQGISMFVPTLLELGTEEQKRRWIEPTLKGDIVWRSEEHTSELQSLMRISYAVFCLKKKTKKNISTPYRAKQKMSQ